MAKKHTSVPINVVLLSGIATGNISHISQSDGMPLLQHQPPLIEVNTGALDGAGNAAVRLTEAGKAMVAQTMPKATNGAVSSPYAVQSGIELPPSKRGNRKGGGAPKQYPFDTLDIGAFFFVPVSDKHPDPVKKLGSTVSSANMRFAEETGEMKTVTRTKRGEGNKKLVNPDGTSVKETVTIPVYKHTRKFVIRAVEAGKQYGSFIAPEHGAVIVRVPLD